MKPLAVTGLGVVSALGVGRAAFFEALSPRADGARPRVLAAPPETFAAAHYPGARVGEVRGFEAAAHLGDKGLRTLDRLSKLLIVATRLSLADAGLKQDGAWPAASAGVLSAADVGLVVANAYGSLEAINELDRVALLEDPRYINPSRFPLTVSNSAAGYASIWEDLRAVNVTVSEGACGALDAVACADMLLDAERARVVLVGGAEALTEPLFVAYRRLGVGGADADAFLGEGAAILALEPPDVAATRGTSPRALVVGYGTAFAPNPNPASLLYASPDAVEAAVAGALADACLRPGDVDAIVSGVSGMAAFDEAECVGIRRALGDAAPIAAPKLAIGEALGASSALAMGVGVAMLQGGATLPVVPPRRSGDGGPRWEWARTAPCRTVLLTATSYYGSASALVMRSASR